MLQGGRPRLVAPCHRQMLPPSSFEVTYAACVSKARAPMCKISVSESEKVSG